MMTWPSTRLSGIPGLTHRESWGLFMAINGVHGRSIRWTSAGDSTPMGHRPEAHEAFQTPQKARVSRFVETFEIVRRPHPSARPATRRHTEAHGLGGATK